MIVLGIETSCDETSVALVDDAGNVLGELVYSQAVHSRYGGVVPELASRHHIRKLYPMTRDLLDSAGVSYDEIGAVAVTAGPGLPGSLLVGTTFAKGFAYAGQKPIIAVNHLEGHIFAAKLACPGFEPPFLALLVSGGHTDIVMVRRWGEYEVLGSTRDDACGEAFDKVAKILGLPYPGGPQIQKCAEVGDPQFVNFPRAMLKSGDFDFSFSGLKTAVLNLVYQMGEDEVRRHLADICASFQEAVVDTLVGKLRAAVSHCSTDRVAIVGGVAANRRLREVASQQGWKLCIPPIKYCTDNATVIALAGLFHLRRGEKTLYDFMINPAWRLGEKLET